MDVFFFLCLYFTDKKENGLKFSASTCRLHSLCLQLMLSKTVFSWMFEHFIVVSFVVCFFQLLRFTKKLDITEGLLTMKFIFHNEKAGHIGASSQIGDLLQMFSIGLPHQDVPKTFAATAKAIVLKMISH